MTSWVKNGTREEIGVLTERVDPEFVPCVIFPACGDRDLCRLTKFIKKLIDTYLEIPWVDTTCGSYACSDQWVDHFNNGRVLK